mmetsp:Transcript_8937/g.36465  ORF Transcript_8937/g.36465 Transcript_8937/m.36465 type:complete len:256 (-) Transcript_8937:1078-1845(-)
MPRMAPAALSRLCHVALLVARMLFRGWSGLEVLGCECEEVGREHDRRLGPLRGCAPGLCTRDHDVGPRARGNYPRAERLRHCGSRRARVPLNCARDAHALASPRARARVAPLNDARTCCGRGVGAQTRAKRARRRDGVSRAQPARRQITNHGTVGVHPRHELAFRNGRLACAVQLNVRHVCLGEPRKGANLHSQARRQRIGDARDTQRRNGVGWRHAHLCVIQQAEDAIHALLTHARQGLNGLAVGGQAKEVGWR